MEKTLQLIKNFERRNNGTCVWQVPSQNLINNDII